MSAKILPVAPSRRNPPASSEMIETIFCRIDDKQIPLYRVLWISATPHYCGEAECQCEGLYEVAVEGGEPIWARHDEKERLMAMIEDWQLGEDHEE